MTVVLEQDRAKSKHIEILYFWHDVQLYRYTVYLGFYVVNSKYTRNSYGKLFFIYIKKVPHSGVSIPLLIFSSVHAPHDPGDDQIANVY